MTLTIARVRLRNRTIWAATMAATLLLAAAPARAAATWAVLPSPNLTSNNNTLSGVDGADAGTVWAVGNALAAPRSDARSLILRWNGTTWSPADHPRPPGASSLQDVDALTTTDAWAVGHQTTDGVGRPLILRWNGTAWTRVNAPTFTSSTSLHDVDARTATDAWAVGAGSAGTIGSRPVALRWNGTAWRSVALPATIGGVSLAVDATGPDDAWLIANQFSGYTGPLSSTTAHWNGTAWQEVPIPNPVNTSLSAITALAPNDVWAVGSTYPGTGAARWIPLILHWDGTTWTRVTSPVQPPDGGNLSDLAALSPTNLYAVGTITTAGRQDTLILRWDGTRWSRIPTTTGLPDPELNAATAIGPGTVWAVGRHYQGTPQTGASRTLTTRATDG